MSNRLPTLRRLPLPHQLVKPGRPPALEFDDRLLLFVQDCAANGLSQSGIAGQLGISPRSLSRAMAKDRRLRKAYEQGKMLCISRVEHQMYKFATSGKHPKQTQFFLETAGGWSKEMSRLEPIYEDDDETDEDKPQP